MYFTPRSKDRSRKELQEYIRSLVRFKSKSYTHKLCPVGNASSDLRYKSTTEIIWYVAACCDLGRFRTRNPRCCKELGRIISSISVRAFRLDSLLAFGKSIQLFGFLFDHWGRVDIRIGCKTIRYEGNFECVCVCDLCECQSLDLL